MSVKRRAEECQRQAAWPKILVSEETTRLIDLLECSKAVHAKSVDRWQQGQAAQPHKSATRAPLSREVQAKSGVT